jgi:uncharacterized membrane protein YccC
VPGGHYSVYAWTNASSLPRDPSHWIVPSLLLPALIVLSGGRGRRRVAGTVLLLGVAVLSSFVLGHAWGGLVPLLIPLAVGVAVSFALVAVDPRPAVACVPLLVAAMPLAWTYAAGDRTTPAMGGLVVVIALPLAAAGLSALALRRTRSGSTRSSL